MTRSIPVLLLLLAWPLPALAQVEVPCPVDQRPLRLASAPWNLAGGIDSDGCGYAVDGKGAQRIVGLEQVAVCATCSTALLREHLVARAKLSADVAERIQAVATRTRKAWPAAKTLSKGRRYELAAAIYLEVGLEPFGAKGDRAAVAGDLLLRAAWAARGHAVLGGPDGGYRPRTPAESRAQLEVLDQRVRHDPSRDPAVRAIDVQLEALDDARLRLRRLGRGDLDRRLGALRAQARLGRVERRLLLRKRDLLKASEGGEGRLNDRELRLAQVRAWIRAGHPERWKPALAELERRRATYAIARLIRESCAEEARLLKLAEAQHLKAVPAAATPAERARLLFLAGDAARRRGDPEGLARLRRAVKAAPKSPGGRRAAALLEE